MRLYFAFENVGSIILRQWQFLLLCVFFVQFPIKYGISLLYNQAQFVPMLILGSVY